MAGAVPGSNRERAMNLNQLLAKLDRASLTMAAPDGRRIIAKEANELRARAQLFGQRERLEKRLAKAVAHWHATNQGESEVDYLRTEIERLGHVDLHARMEEAQRVLSMWENH